MERSFNFNRNVFASKIHLSFSQRLIAIFQNITCITLRYTGHFYTLHVMIWKVEYAVQKCGLNSETRPSFNPSLYTERTQSAWNVFASNDKNTNMFDVLIVYIFKGAHNDGSHSINACRKMIGFTKEHVLIKWFSIYTLCQSLLARVKMLWKKNWEPYYCVFIL